jgi:HlyD family secretion protein
MPRRKFLIVAILALVTAACDGTSDDRRVVGELASDRLELIAEVNEPILEILVAEGEPVRTGQLILRQDDTRASARLAEAEAAAGQARARLDELVRGPREEQIRQARANLDGAVYDVEYRELRYARARDLFEKELGSEENRDRAKSQLDAANATLALRRAQLEELLAGTTIEELEQAEQALVQAESRRDAARIDVDRHEIRAPAGGLFDSRLFEPGERPVPGQPVAIMLGGNQVYARIFVPERLRVHVTPGTPAEIHVDGLDGAVTGRVRWVASEAAFTPYFALTERDRGRLTFLAKVDITEERERLPDGVPVEVELRLADGE